MDNDSWEKIELKVTRDNIPGVLLLILSVIVFIFMFNFTIQINALMFLATFWWLLPIVFILIVYITAYIIYFLSQIIGNLTFSVSGINKQKTATIFSAIIVILTNIYCCLYMNTIKNTAHYNADNEFRISVILCSILFGVMTTLFIQIFELDKHKDKFNEVNTNLIEYRHSLDRIDDFRK